MNGKDVFDWKNVLSSSVEAADVSFMKHAPGHAFWKNSVSVGMKLVVCHQEPYLPRTRGRVGLQPNPTQTMYWVATVQRIEGYYCLVRYEGMDDDSNDFWVHLGLDDVYSIGGEANYVLVPPTCINKRVRDWRDYMAENLTGKKTLPNGFQELLQLSVNGSKYKIGDCLEVLDNKVISQLRIARVIKITGRRLYLKYVDENINGKKLAATLSKTDISGFFCHEESEVVHPLGWTKCIGHKLKYPKLNKLTIKQQSRFQAMYGKKKSEVDLPQSTTMTYNGLNFQEGMKLEARDPLCPSRICAATICKLLRHRFIMLKMDCYEESGESGSEDEKQWFCYKIDSPYIFKCGFCKENGIALVPPHGYNGEGFEWDEYLKSGAEAAPIPDKPVINHGFKLGMKLEMADLMNPSKVHVASVAQVVGHLLRINFDGWAREYDQWMGVESPDIYPIGWCALAGHKLEPVNQEEDKGKCSDGGETL